MKGFQLGERPNTPMIPYATILWLAWYAKFVWKMKNEKSWNEGEKKEEKPWKMKNMRLKCGAYSFCCSKNGGLDNRSFRWACKCIHNMCEIVNQLTLKNTTIERTIFRHAGRTWQHQSTGMRDYFLMWFCLLSCDHYCLRTSLLRAVTKYRMGKFDQKHTEHRSGIAAPPRKADDNSAHFGVTSH